jgi:chromosome partitioning protein
VQTVSGTAIGRKFQPANMRNSPHHFELHPIRADHNPELQVDGIVVNQFQARANLPQRMVAELIEEGLPVLQPYLPSSVRIRESHELAKPMIYLDPNHKITLALIELHDSLRVI